MARHVRGGAAEEKTRGEGILRWGRERGAGERDGEGVSWGETEEYAVSDDYVENRGDARRAEVGSRERGDEETRGGRGISSGCRAARCRAHPEGLSDDGDALAARADENGASVATTGEGCAFRASEGRVAERRVAGNGRARGRRRGGLREGHRCRGHRQRSRGVKWLGEGAEPLTRHHQSRMTQRQNHLPERFPASRRHRRFLEFFL